MRQKWNCDFFLERAGHAKGFKLIQTNFIFLNLIIIKKVGRAVVNNSSHSNNQI